MLSLRLDKNRKNNKIGKQKYAQMSVETYFRFPIYTNICVGEVLSLRLETAAVC